MAATTPTSATFAPTSGKTLVLATAAFMSPRLLLAGARLPRGVHAILAFPAAPVEAAPGPGRRGAMRVVVAASAGSEEAGNAGDDYEEEMSHLHRGIKEVIDSWNAFERSKGPDKFYEPYEMVCFDEPMVGKLQMHAWRGVDLVTNVLVDLAYGRVGREGMWESDLKNLKVAGMDFLSVALQAQRGYVRATSVREAVHKLVVLYTETISPAGCPPIAPPAAEFALKDAPSPMLDPSSYYKDLAESIDKTIYAVQAAFLRRRSGLV